MQLVEFKQRYSDGRGHWAADDGAVRGVSGVGRLLADLVRFSVCDVRSPLPLLRLFHAAIASVILMFLSDVTDPFLFGADQNSSSALGQRHCLSRVSRASTSAADSSPWTLLSRVRTLTPPVVLSFSPTTAETRGDTEHSVPAAGPLNATTADSDVAQILLRTSGEVKLEGEPEHIVDAAEEVQAALHL
ncbi:hypothetical protein EYF80_041310 [Liparis tanakae]|uniref:Uncharacterized protein n=1 Tax=Liparis tanakae TaxID=230148 RepID=A0A4Z2G4M5_9TELE|nr:hypothetical protein EYF80_041310 [Liparis tanakae]